jgi:hypothetical protein
MQKAQASRAEERSRARANFTARDTRWPARQYRPTGRWAPDKRACVALKELLHMVNVKDLQPGTLLVWDRRFGPSGLSTKPMVMVLWKTMKHNDGELLDVGFMSLETFEIWKSYPTHDDTFDSLTVF